MPSEPLLRLLCALGVACAVTRPGLAVADALPSPAAPAPSRAPAPPPGPSSPPSPAPDDGATLDQALSPASADEPRELVLAREAFRDGSLLAKKGRWIDALAAFRRSAELRPHPITTYDIGYCERALGHFVRAYDAFDGLLRPRGGGPSPLSPERVKLAGSYVEEVSPRIVRLTVTPAARDLTLRVDGLPLEPLRQQGDHVVLTTATAEKRDAPALPVTFELWLDPGTHLFLVTARDGSHAVEAHTFAPGATVPLALAAPPPRSAPANPEARGPTSQAPATPVAASADRTWAFVALGVGAAGLVAGSVVLGMGVSEQRSLDASCPGRACPEDPDLRDRAARVGRLFDIATVGYAVALAGAGVGTYLWVTAPPSPRVSTVTVGVGAGTVSVSGRF